MPQPRDRAPARPPVAGPPSWVRLVVGVLALAGLGVATYLTVAHYDATVTLACPETGLVNCARVTTSAESEIADLPVALLGLVFFAAMGLLSLPASWARRSLDLPRLALAGAGVAFVLWLVYAEIVRIGAICLWCTSVHVITLVMFLVLLYDLLNRRSAADR
jgi:uncharacterized membrane protein